MDKIQSWKKEEEPHWGGMRNPRKISREMPGYRLAGHRLCQVLQVHLKEHPDVAEACFQAIGSLEEDMGPTAAQQEEMAKLLMENFQEMPTDTETGLHTRLRPGLIWTLARAAGDPEADEIYDWLTQGAPAGLSPSAGSRQHLSEDLAQGETEMELPDPERHHNYSSVDGDEMAEPEIQRLIATGFVEMRGNLEEFIKS